MSVKHVEQYYNEICAQYQEMLQDIKDFEAEAEKGLIEPERIERLKEQIAPVKNNYERWCYMMFLLHQPARKSKVPKYKRGQKKFLQALSSENSLESVLEENKEAMRHIGE